MRKSCIIVALIGFYDFLLENPSAPIVTDRISNFSRQIFQKTT